jgi:hypothetical protein
MPALRHVRHERSTAGSSGYEGKTPLDAKAAQAARSFS